MTDESLRAKGTAMRTKLMGEEYATKLNSTLYADPTMVKFRELATDIAFGSVWTRPGLDLKTRAMLCVASDTATGRYPELAVHLRMARNQGWSEEELTEAILHLSVYVGLPLVREALITAGETFAELRGEAEGG
jgi:4-carboxymuconolactone decarboxylase